MSEQIFINTSDFETRVALVDQGVLQELHIERDSQKGVVGNIYLGKITRILPNLQSAFINIGLERNAFMHVGDLYESRVARQNSEALPKIEKLFFEGQTLLVQVIKNPVNDKGARLSNQINIAGRIMVYMPFNEHIGISQRIEIEEEREKLRDWVQNLRGSDDVGGYIIRTFAETCEESDLKRDMDYLRLQWEAIQKRAKNSKAPKLVYEELSLTHRVLRDFANANTTNIEIDSEPELERMKAWSTEYTPAVTEKLNLYKASRPIFDLNNIEEDIEIALSQRVNLPSGGYLIFDSTEALTSIDVNTGSFLGSRNFNDTILKTNLEASLEIARQLRLRNVGGIIIIDFIDMVDNGHKEQVMFSLKNALSRDRVRTTVNDFSCFGLVEMTRKRAHSSLASMLMEKCPTCEGRGSVKTAKTIVYQIMREIQREAKLFNPTEFRLILSSQVLDLFLDEESQYFTALSDAIGKPISLEVDDHYSQEMYDIILC
ncbi:Rne/Rng family ribonuclease [Taylorella equigenitalis]|uniref:Rne/Rng family ribonuclease n=1 Tax=Taylorella equigenitalis TaxID=29575 RepID=UPI0003FAB3BD|nr:Rne/Rng family ribonuclease [Taylorella equigenitalis]WDU54018.1 Rne/Rng family ribonuclease [Taylorella equigenitalis]